MLGQISSGRKLLVQNTNTERRSDAQFTLNAHTYDGYWIPAYKENITSKSNKYYVIAAHAKYFVLARGQTKVTKNIFQYSLFQRVKILFNKKDTALIQMAEPQQAVLALQNLDKVT